MENILSQISGFTGVDVRPALVALAVLVLGWIAALILAAIVRGALRRTEVDNQIAAWFAGDERMAAFDLEAAVGKIVFYMTMLFVIVAAFETLGLTAVTEPMRALLERVMAFAPQLLSAGVLLGLAWLAASVVKLGVSKAVAFSKLEARVVEESGEEKPSKPLGETIGEALYWFIFLLVLPGVLETLSLDGMLEPVQQMMNKVTGFLPNLFTAGVTLAVGWLLARIVQRIVTSFAAAVGVDAVSERAGLEAALGGQPASKILGMVLYVFLFIPILISALSALHLDAVTGPLSNMLNMILEAIPSLFAALLVLAVSYVIGRVVSGLVTNLLAGVGFNRVLEKLGMGTAVPDDSKTSPATVVGSIVLAFIMLFASVEAANLLGFDSLEGIVADVLAIGGRVLFGVVIFGLGLLLANFAADAIRASGAPNSSLLGTLARVAILLFTGAVALSQMGLADDIIALAFGLTLGAVAVASAIAFGIGGRDVAAKQLENWSRSLENRAQDSH